MSNIVKRDKFLLEENLRVNSQINPYPVYTRLTGRLAIHHMKRNNNYTFITVIYYSLPNLNNKQDGKFSRDFYSVYCFLEVATKKLYFVNVVR